MEKGFWLVNLDNLSVSVSLVIQSEGKYFVRQLGPVAEFETDNQESLLTAADHSLSSASESASLEPDAEPNSAAFILPPFWIGADGKIAPQYLKLIETICKNLKLKPLGFVSHDEAIVEAASSSDGFPASFILVYLNRHLLSLTLVYLGKIKERVDKVLDSEFNPSIIENILIDIGSDSALPPQIILFGQINDDIAAAVKNYQWIGKKNIETFLHFPDVSVYSPADLANVYSQVVGAQFTPSSSAPTIDVATPKPIETSEEVEVVDDENSSDLAEVSADDLGFSSVSIVPEVEPVPEIKEEVVPIEEPVIDTPVAVSPPSPVEVRSKLPRLKLPQSDFFSIRYLIFVPLLLLMVLGGLIFFSSSRVIVYLTPYTFSKTVDVTLDPNNNDYPVSQKTFEINSSSSVKTTGQKTIGSNAKGEVVIFNKSDKVQNLASGTVLTSSNGLKFTTSSSVQIPASSANLDSGTITMGQTKAIVTAVDIGPESNLAKDSLLSAKDSSLVVKVASGLSGGVKRQTAAVSVEDKNSLEQKIKQDVENSIKEKMAQELSGISGIIPNTTNIKRNRIEYSREVGEEADELSANSSNSVSVLYLTSDQKVALINKVFSGSTNFNDIVFNQFNFNINYNKGKLTIDGKSAPRLDTNSLRQKLTGKLVSQVPKIIRQAAPRTYNYQIITPLPFLFRNITIDLK